MAKTLADKFFMKPGQHVAILSAPDNYLAEVLNPVPEGVHLAQTLDGIFDHIQWFVTTKHQLLEMAEQVKSHLKPDGSLWINYPKGGTKARITTDVHRDSVHQTLAPFGVTPNQMISIDDVWSSLRFKIVE